MEFCCKQCIHIGTPVGEDFIKKSEEILNKYEEQTKKTLTTLNTTPQRNNVLNHKPKKQSILELGEMAHGPCHQVY